MKENTEDTELSQWLSTYGMITADRILSKYEIKLSQGDLYSAIKTPTSFYHHLLKAPLKNVLNGIILDQASDYHVYVQKLFIDYLMSGEGGKDASLPGAGTRENLEAERTNLVKLGEEFTQLQFDHNNLVASSQSFLIKSCKQYNKIFDVLSSEFAEQLNKPKKTIVEAIQKALIHSDMYQPDSQKNTEEFVHQIVHSIDTTVSSEIHMQLVQRCLPLTEVLKSTDSTLNSFIKLSQQLGDSAKSYREKFYEMILRVNDFLKSLPDYKMNEEQVETNKEVLHFDKTIG